MTAGHPFIWVTEVPFTGVKHERVKAEIVHLQDSGCLQLHQNTLIILEQAAGCSEFMVTTYQTARRHNL
jgi:hypothetical protein